MLSHPLPVKDESTTAPEPSEYQRVLSANQGSAIDEKTQQMLNKPANHQGTRLSSEDKAFLDDLIRKVDDGDINLYQPTTIVNQEVYDQLAGGNRAKTDLFVNSTLFVIRQVYDFYKSDYSNESDMMVNMVQELRYKKETLEGEIGDVLKI